MPTITSIDQLDPNGTYTIADYLSWQFTETVEIIKGKLFLMSPAPILKHQIVSGNIFGQLFITFRKTPCKVFSAPFDVYLSRENPKPTVVQPDICVICSPLKMIRRGCEGAPEIVFEILSPATSQKDLKDKYQAYEQYGVQEYWIVYPEEEVLHQFVHDGNKFTLANMFVEGMAQSAILENIILDVDEIFDREPGQLRSYADEVS